MHRWKFNFFNFNNYLNADSYVYLCGGNSAKQQILIYYELSVYLNTEAYHSRKSVYVARVSVFDSLEIDYSSILRVMRVIYGNSCIVVFTCL